MVLGDDMKVFVRCCEVQIAINLLVKKLHP